MIESFQLRKRKIHESDCDSVLDEEIEEIIRDIESDRGKEQSKESNTRWSKSRTAIHAWARTCSFHGIPHMAQSLSPITILLWMILLLTCASLFVILINNTIRQYLAYNTVVNLIIGMDQSYFPAITFCNSNPYKLSAIKKIPELEALLTIYNQALG